MNITIITIGIPYPLNSGGAVAQYYFLDKMRHDMHVTLLTRVTNSEQLKASKELQQKWPEMGIHVYEEYPIETKRNLLQRAANRLQNWVGNTKKDIPETWEYTSLAEESCDYVSDEYAQWLLNKVNASDPDIIQVEFYPLLELIYLLPTNCKRIYIQHEIRYIRNALECQTCLDTNRARMQYGRLKGREIAAMNAYDAVLTLTDVDRDKLLHDGVTAPIYSSTAAVTDAFLPEMEERKSCKRLCFLGAGSHSPNSDGLTWFLQEIFPKVQEQIIDAELSIVGRWSAEQQAHLTQMGRNVHFMGFVESLPDALHDCIMIVPLRVGSGMRLKIMEAVFYGVPLITTSVGVEGLEYIHNEDCIIADSAEDFAQGIIDLCQNADLQKRLCLHARKTYKDKYSLTALYKKRTNIYSKILKD